MSIDLLHEKIRKLKNPTVLDFSLKPNQLPPHLLEDEGDYLSAYSRFCRELMAELKGNVPAVRFSFDAFALMGCAGLDNLSELLNAAGEMGYYRTLDCSAIHTPWDADRAAQTLFGEAQYPAEALIISPFIGTDAIKPFLPFCKEGRSLFVMARTPNKTALELQDLMTGSRLVCGAAAELAVRSGEGNYGKCGYSNIGALAAAGAPDSLRNLRTKHNRLFLLVDGIDYPSGNAKNCSLAFDRLGFGAAVSAGPCITAAWQEAGSDGRDYLQQAMLAAERIKKNITRYVTIL